MITDLGVSAARTWNEGTSRPSTPDIMSAVGARMELEAEVRRLVRRHAPAVAADRVLAADVPLGEGGLALDSVALVELPLECESRFGMPVTEELLEQRPLTIGVLVDHLRRSPWAEHIGDLAAKLYRGGFTRATGQRILSLTARFNGFAAGAGVEGAAG